VAVQNILRNTPEKSSAYCARAERALKLFEERGHEIEYLGFDHWRVPATRKDSSLAADFYTVLYAEHEACSCKDFEFGGGKRACKHLLAVGILHAARRSGVVVKQSFAAAAGDGFAYAAKRRRGCPRCFGGYVTIGIEEDGQERHEAVPCRCCNAESL
jgi:hypothetical protein